MSRAQYVRPSGAATWIVCFGYAAMRAAYPVAPEESDDEIREDGIACHWLAPQVHGGNSPKLNSLSPNGRVITEEMFDAVDLYLDVVRKFPGVHHIEESLSGDCILQGMTGTPDWWSWDGTTLSIADLKFGYRFVEVWYNWQLVCYAAMILAHLGINGLLDQHVKVRFVIVQPRSTHAGGPVRSWTVKASDLRGQINQLRHAAAKAMEPLPVCTPNPYCGDCPGRHACTALQNSALGALEVSYAGVPLELDAAAAGDELRRLAEASKRIEARMTGLQMQVEGLIKQGTVVPHWSLEPSYARERWRDGTESHVMTLGTLYGCDLTKPPVPISPTQARKVLPENVVAMYACKPSTGVRLTRQDPLQAHKAFSNEQST